MEREAVGGLACVGVLIGENDFPAERVQGSLVGKCDSAAAGGAVIFAKKEALNSHFQRD